MTYIVCVLRTQSLMGTHGKVPIFFPLKNDPSPTSRFDICTVTSIFFKVVHANGLRSYFSFFFPIEVHQH